MSEQISWLLQVAINPGKLDDFRGVVADLVAGTESEPGTLDYEWHLSEDQTICHIFERYRDNAAVLIHLEGFGKFAARFMEACHPTRFHVYGTPSDDVRAALLDLGPVYFERFAGFSR